MTGDRTRSAFRIYSLHCTKKLLDRIKPSIATSLPLPPRRLATGTQRRSSGSCNLLCL